MKIIRNACLANLNWPIAHTRRGNTARNDRRFLSDKITIIYNMYI